MKPAYQKIYDQNMADFGHLKDDQIMGLTIYAEARGEPREGKIGVGSTILERVEHRDWDGKTIMEVCLWPYQFSCYLPSDPNRGGLLNIAQNPRNFYPGGKTLKTLRDCVDIARWMIAGTTPKNTTALQYLNPLTAAKTKGKWLAAGMKVVMKIGNHEWFA
jgi:spore germination cell wall hydrolase CwlJ-like protein